MNVQPSDLDDDGDYAESLLIEHRELSGTFPTYLSNSTLVSIWTFFELSAVRLCHIDLERRGTAAGTSREQIAKQHARVFGYGQVADYRDKNGLQDKASPESQEITNIQLVRNCIAHGNGKVASIKKPADLRAYVEAQEQAGVKSLSIIGDYLVVLNEYCEYALKTCHSFLTMQLHGIPSRSV